MKFFKLTDAELIDVEPGKREIVACISTPAVDRDGEIVLPSGLVRKNYGGMTVFYNHDTDKPIAVSKWIKASANRVLAKSRFSDKTQFARDCFALAQDGILNGYSIGATSLESGPPTAQEIKTYGAAKRIYRQWEPFEYSLVGILANPEAVALAISKGISPETIAILGMQEKTAAPIEAAAQSAQATLPTTLTNRKSLSQYAWEIAAAINRNLRGS
jgi:hypothetical protein